MTDMTIAPSQIEQHKERLRSEFNKTRLEIEALNLKLTKIKAQLDFADQLLGQSGIQRGKNDWLAGYEIPAMQDKGVTEAIKTLVEANPEREFTIAQFQDAMKRAHVPNAASLSFRQVLYVTAKRLADDNILTSSTEGKYKTFKLSK